MRRPKPNATCKMPHIKKLLTCVRSPIGNHNYCFWIVITNLHQLTYFFWLYQLIKRYLVQHLPSSVRPHRLHGEHSCCVIGQAYLTNHTAPFLRLLSLKLGKCWATFVERQMLSNKCWATKVGCVSPALWCLLAKIWHILSISRIVLKQWSWN